MSNERLYPIQPDLGGFTEWSKYFPGVTPSGEQVILFTTGPTMHAYRFDTEGRYLGRLDRANALWPANAPFEQRFEARLAGVLAWAGELGLRPATIRVREFECEPRGPSLDLQDYPSYYDEGLFTDEERQEWFRRWRKLGAFVLHWDTTGHTLTGEGERFEPPGPP